jgi:hypothetical protein
MSADAYIGAAIGVVGTLLGVLVTYFLTIHRDKARERESLKTQLRSIRNELAYLKESFRSPLLLPIPLEGSTLELIRQNGAVAKLPTALTTKLGKFFHMAHAMNNHLTTYHQLRAAYAAANVSPPPELLTNHHEPANLLRSNICGLVIDLLENTPGWPKDS